jgi:hypothetical protein
LGNLKLLRRTRVPMTWHQIMGHKGPVLRPKCIVTERAQTPLLLYALYSEPMMKSAVFSIFITLLLVRHNMFVIDT